MPDITRALCHLTDSTSTCQAIRRVHMLSYTQPFYVHTHAHPQTKYMCVCLRARAVAHPGWLDHPPKIWKTNFVMNVRTNSKNLEVTIFSLINEHFLLLLNDGLKITIGKFTRHESTVFMTTAHDL